MPRKRATSAWRKLNKRQAVRVGGVGAATGTRYGSPKPTKVFVGPKAQQTYLGREAERMSRELDEMTPSAIYSTLPKVKYVQGVRVGKPSRELEELVVVDLSGKLTPLEVKVEGAVPPADTALGDAGLAPGQKIS